MYLTHSRKRLLSVILIGLLSLSGCGASSPSASSSEPSSAQEAEDAFTYSLSEQFLPDPTEGFTPEDENLVLSEQDCRFLNGKLCYLYTIFRMEGEYNLYHGSYLCILDAPYTEYQCYSFLIGDWSPDCQYFAGEVIGISEQGVLLTLASSEDDVLSFSHIGLFSTDGACQLLGELSTDAETSDFYLTEDTLYCISGSQLTAYDPESLQPAAPKTLNRRLLGCLREDLWYGFNADNQLTVWDNPDGKELFLLGDMVTPYSAFCLTAAGDGTFFLADTGGLWLGDGKSALQKSFSFMEKNYGIQEVLGISAPDTDTVFLLTRFEDALCLLTAKKGTDAGQMQKEEITLVAPNASALEAAAAAFNRKSETYHVSVTDSWRVADREDYLRTVQMELSAGKGPDLLGQYIVDTAGGIENGFFEPLDDLVPESDDYWTAALDCGRTNGLLYGVPYDCLLSLPVVSARLANGSDCWTMEEMIAAVKISDAEAFQKGADGMSLALSYGFYIDNPQFIDYDAGISHLKEQPFLDFLEFTKEYADTLYYNDAGDNTADYYRSGQLAACYQTIASPSDLLFPEACFEGEEVLIGYPSPEGRRILMSADLLYLNAASVHKEGAKAFLRYLLSEEGQLCYTKSYNDYGILSCRRDVTEQILDKYQQQSAKNTSTMRSVGVTYDIVPLDGEQSAAFLRLFQDAAPALSVSSALAGILTDELTAFYEGQCSAAETADKLHNRVQLYLDEQN